MSKEICISSTPHETRLAILEDDQLTEVYYERENEYTLAGSIYKGRVTRVLPGMQSAFVDLGLERDAFLYVTDFMEEQEDSSDFERIPANGRPEEGREPQAKENREPREPRQPRAASAAEEEAPGATAFRQVREGQHPARGRLASLRMEPGAGEAAVAAARVFAQHKAGSREPRNKRPQYIPMHPPATTCPQPRQPCRSKPARVPQSPSLFPGSRFRSMAVRALPRHLRRRPTAVRRSNEPTSSLPSPPR